MTGSARDAGGVGTASGKGRSAVEKRAAFLTLWTRATRPDHAALRLSSQGNHASNRERMKGTFTR